MGAQEFKKISRSASSIVPPESQLRLPSSPSGQEGADVGVGVGVGVGVAVGTKVGVAVGDGVGVTVGLGCSQVTTEVNCE